jgi:hypothetical protein
MRFLLLVLLVAGCRKGTESKIALRYHPPAGAVYHYALEQRTQVTMPSAEGRAGPLSGMKRQEMQLRMYSTQTVTGSAAGGEVDMEILIDSVSMVMPGMSPELSSQVARMRGTKSSAIFNDRLELVRNDMSGLQGAPPEVANQLAGVLKGMAYAFPEQPVGRGDSWTVSIELPVEQFGGVDASKAGHGKTTLTVRDIRTTERDTSVVLDIKTTFPTGPVQLPMAGQRASMTLSGELTGYQEFSISRGTVVDASIKGQTTINLSVAMLQIRDMTVNTQTESTLRLVAAK